MQAAARTLAVVETTGGNNWADDNFTRHFTIFQDKSSLLVVEQFKDGNFSTPSTTPPNTNESPGACNNGQPNNGGTVAAGISGSFHGYFVIPLPSSTTQTSPSPFCDAVGMTNSGCTTATFINTHFSPCYPTTCPVTTFFFHYSAGDQLLMAHEWKDASPDRGGLSGDIRSA
jgi:hypothetical protein